MKEPRGYLALIAAIIISVVLLGLATAVGEGTFFSRFNALNREYKRVSLGLAESCVHAALAKVAEDYDYVVPPGGEEIDLGEVYGRDATCTITGPTSAPAEAGGKKVFAISTKAEFSGAFSSISVEATAQDPEEAPVVPPPTCTLTVSPSSIPQGQSAQLLWSTSSNAETMTIDHGIGSVGLSGPPWESVTPSGVGSITYVATVGNAGGTNECEATLTVNPPPPAPSCADTVMMLDRSYSMFGWPDYPSGYQQWVPNERAAAKALIDLYDGVSSNPKVGFGRIADLGDGRGADLVRELSSSYASLKSAIDSSFPEMPIGYTNLGEAIDVAAQELDSVRHDPDNEKVLIFVSDGIPNEPSSGITLDTGWLSPSATAAPNEWASAAHAFSSDDARATADDDDDDQGYRNFNFSVPSGATIRGIEVSLEAYSSVGGPAATTLLSDSFGTGGTDGSFDEAPSWTEGGGGAEKRAPGSGNDSASPDGGRFATIFNGGYICEQVDASGATALQLSYRWRGDSDANESSDDGVVEYRTGGSCSSGGGWTALQNHDLRDDGAWSTQNALSLPSSLNNATFFLRYRASSDNNEYFRVDGISLTGTVAPANSSCQLQARIGDAGSFSSFRSVTLSGTEAVLASLGSPTDDWDNVTWTAGDFGNGSFRLETRFNDPDASCADSAVANLDQVRARVHFSVPVDPEQYALDAASDAKSDDVSIFSIHFGDTDGLDLMRQLSSASLIPASSITSATRSGGSATITTNAAHRIADNQRVSISGVGNGAYNGTFTVTDVPSPTTFRFNLSGSGNSSGGSVTPQNVFVSPSSGAMDDIFESIGIQVCPAAAAECSNTIDDDGDGLSDEADPGCHDDEDAANLGSYDPDDNDEWSTPAVPQAPPPPPPPPNIVIGPWIEN